MTLYARQQKRRRCKEQTFGLWEKARVGWFERIALKHIYYSMWIRWPVQLQCMKRGTQNQCTGTTQRDGIRRRWEWSSEQGGSGHMYTRGWFMSTYGKNHRNIVLASNLNKFKKISPKRQYDLKCYLGIKEEDKIQLKYCLFYEAFASPSSLKSPGQHKLPRLVFSLYFVLMRVQCDSILL